MHNFMTRLFENPIYIKEQYVRKHREERQFYKIYPIFYFLAFYIVPIMGAAYIQHEAYGEPDSFVKWFFSLIVILVGLFFSFKSASIALGLICRERENGTFTALLGTMMTSADIFAGNFWVAFAPTALELTYIFPSILITGYLLKFNLIALSFTYIFILIFIALFGVIGVYCSSDSNSLWEARDKTTGIMLYLFVGFTGSILIVTGLSLYFLPPLGWITVPLLFVISSVNPLINIAVLMFVGCLPPEMGWEVVLLSTIHLILGIIAYWLIARYYYRKAVE